MSNDLALAEKLFKNAFDKPRDPRSDEYKAGVRAALRFRFAGEKIPTPYESGTAQSDAYYSGLDEGHSIFREYEAGNKNPDL